MAPSFPQTPNECEQHNMVSSAPSGKGRTLPTALSFYRNSGIKDKPGQRGTKDRPQAGKAHEREQSNDGVDLFSGTFS